MTAATATKAAPHGGHGLPVARPVRLARVAGVLYLTLAILGGLAQPSVRPHAIVPASARTLVWWLGRKEEPQVTRPARTIRAGPPM